MKISVVIPVYNAEKYVEHAVESALRQNQTGEVILVEDNSPDNALEICERLSKEYPRVRLLTHGDGKNHGAGESRNLGIRNARYDYIAFLDADDFYVDNCFSMAEEVLSNDTTVDGVYSAVGAIFENEEARRRYFASHPDEIATIERKANPGNLFRYLVMGGAGYIHLNGLVVKKAGLLKVGAFPQLRLHQDMVLTIKLAAMQKLVAGDIDNPVSIRRLHDNNRITNPETNFSETMYMAYRYLLRWSRDNHLPGDKQHIVRNKYRTLGYQYYRDAGKYPLAAYYYVLSHL